MRTLLALTALMMLLATAVWWKTRPGDAPTNLPATTSEDSMRGVSTLGAKEEVGTQRNQLAKTNFPKTPSSNPSKDARPSDAGGDHEGGTPTPSSLPKDPRTVHNLPVDTKPPAQPPVDPQPVIPQSKPTAPVGMSYTVQSGDTLYRIVVRSYGTAPSELVEAVAEANGMRDSASLDVGQKLRLPLISGFPEPQRP